MESGRPYTLQFFKHPDIPHWRHETVWLGEDEWGVWLGAAAGAMHQKGSGPARPGSSNQVHLVPRNDWWVFTYRPSHRRATHFIDTSTPATFEAERVTMVDLDLDIARSPDGTVWVEDEDEFVEHQGKYGYSSWLIMSAERATRRMEEALRQLREPFDRVATTWLARL